MPGPGYSLQLENLNDPESIPGNWKMSSTVYGSPGLPNGSEYHFQPPAGRDSVFDNSQEITIRWHATDDFYSDADGHGLAAIAVIHTDGPGTFRLGGAPVSGDGIHAPADLTFTPAAAATGPSLLLYKFIDRSGQASALHTLSFRDVTGTGPQPGTETDPGSLRIVPSPARDNCTLEWEGITGGPFRLTVIDLTGKVLLQKEGSLSENRLVIDVTDLPGGICFCLLEHNGHLRTGKMAVLTLP